MSKRMLAAGRIPARGRRAGGFCPDKWAEAQRRLHEACDKADGGPHAKPFLDRLIDAAAQDDPDNEEAAS